MKTERALSEQEIKTLDKRQKKINKQKRLYWYLFKIIAAWLIGGTFIAVYKNLQFMYVVGIVVICTIPTFWASLRQRNEAQKKIKKIQALRKLNRVTSIKVQTTEFYELEEEEEEGVYYLFQIAPDKIICFGGEGFDSTKKFPNSDFEIVEAKGSDRQILFRKIYSHGNKIEPLKVISGSEKKELLAKLRPDEYQIIDGKLV